MRRVGMAVFGTLLLAAVFPLTAQHAGHGGARPKADPAACAEHARQSLQIIDRIGRRLEEARQSNNPAKMRAAMDDLQLALGELKAHQSLSIGAATPGPIPPERTAPPAGPNAPAMDHSKMGHGMGPRGEGDGAALGDRDARRGARPRPIGARMIHPHHEPCGDADYVGRAMRNDGSPAGRRLRRSAGVVATVVVLLLVSTFPYGPANCCSAAAPAPEASAMLCCAGEAILKGAVCPTSSGAPAAATAWVSSSPEGATLLAGRTPVLGPALQDIRALRETHLPRHAESPPLYRLHAQLLI